MVDPQRRITFEQPDRIAGDLGQAVVEDGAEGLQRIGVLRVVEAASLAHRREALTLRQPVAALGLAARVVDQAEALAPALDQRQHALDRTRHELELELPDPGPGVAGDQPAFVEGHLDHRAAGADPAGGAPHLGAVAHPHLQAVGAGALEQHQQAVTDAGAGMLERLGDRSRADHLMLEAFQRIGATGLQRLDPAAPLAAQAPGDAVARQAAILGVEVHGRQRASLQRGRTARHLGGQGLPNGRRDEELEFDFLGCAHAVSWATGRLPARARARATPRSQCANCACSSTVGGRSSACRDERADTRWSM